MALYEKLFKIMDESKAIEKNLTVQFKTAKYSAISESAVLNEVKTLLKKHKVIILPVNVVAEHTERDNRDPLTRLLVTWKIIDTESGEFELVQSPGNGVDSQDKGSGKAFTYAYKTVMQKCFMLFSGDDTDNTHSDELDEHEIAQAAAIKAAAAKVTAAKAAAAKAAAAKAKPEQAIPADLKSETMNPVDRARLDTLKALFDTLPERNKLAALDAYSIAKIEDLPKTDWISAIQGLTEWKKAHEPK